MNLRLLALVLSCGLSAHRGERPSRKQTLPPDGLVVPDASALSAADELVNVQVPEGFGVKLLFRRATAPKGRFIRIVLRGLRGPIELGGTSWNLEMPGQGHLLDDELAKVVRYLRRAIGDQA